MKVLSEEENGLSLVCEFRDTNIETIPIPYCWPLANTNNRYHYVKQRYMGQKGIDYSKQLKNKDDEFFLLQKIFPQIQSLINDIGSLQIEDSTVPVSGFLELSLIQKQDAEMLQDSDIAKSIESTIPPEDFDDDIDPDEYVQLDLI